MTSSVAATVVGQAPTRADLIVYQGDDFDLKVVMAPATPPVDLTTYTAKAQIRSAPGASTILAAFTVTIPDAATILLHLPSAQSQLLTSKAAWDVQITAPGGRVTTLAYGAVMATRQVTT